MARSPVWYAAVVLGVAMLGFASCGGRGVSGGAELTPQPASLTGDATGDSQDGAERVAVPGAPGLTYGARIIPDRDAPVSTHMTATAGVDFPADRFIVIFEDQPAAQALAPYLSTAGGADLIRPTDNVPLVNHSYFRRVSSNLGQAYGLNLVSRVFYKDVHFAVYEMPEVSDVAVLDTMMLRVLYENAGLVREVCYDMYVQACGESPPLPTEELTRIFDGNPAGYHAQENADDPAVKTTSIAAPDDPYYVNKDGDDNDDGRGLWGLWRMGAVHDQAWDSTTGSSNVVVAVVDTGVRYTHEDLVDNCIDPENDPPYNADGILTDVISKDNKPLDGHGHGTFCAGQIGAKGNNSKGLPGVCWNVTLLPIRVLNNGGSGSDAQVAEGMLIADYLGANIISMSLGGPFPDRTTQLASQQCDSDGILLVVAAGNDNNDGRFYPGGYKECLCVGATTLVNSSDDEDFTLVDGVLPISTRYDARATFSNYGDWVDIAAPGRKILATGNGSNTNYKFGWQGTSMATPNVAGCAALLWAYIDNPTADEVRALLQSSATEMTHFNNAANPDGFEDDTSNGTVRFCNVYEAIQLYDDASYPWSAPTITWHDDNNDGDTLSDNVTLKVAVTAASGASILKVEIETYARFIGAETTPSGGYYEFPWDTAFEFNRTWEVTCKAYDDKGNMAVNTIDLTTSNTHTTPAFSEDFTGLADNAVPSNWYEFDGNSNASGNTSWGASSAESGDAAPALHSSGTTANYASYSNDWILLPIIDLGSYAGAELTLNQQYAVNSGDYAFCIGTADDRQFRLFMEKSNASETWTPKTYDLSSFGGGEVRLFWVLQANGSGNNTGIWIDDVEIAALSGDMPTITINSPDNGDSVSGIVTINVTINDVTQLIKLVAVPPKLGYSTWALSDGTYNLSWDSRHTYNGAVLIKLYAYDNTDMDNLVATASRALTVTNPTRDPTWYESFESIGTLGGTSGTSFDGDWYTFSWGTAKWRIASEDSHTGSDCAKMGPDGTGNYGNYEFDQLYSPVHNCSSATRPHLRLWHKLDTGDDTGDYGKILLVRYDGLDDTETPLAEYRTDTSSGWERLIFDLTPYKSDPFRLNFLFISDGSTAGKGWFIDDFEIIDADPDITSISDNARGQLGDTRTINGTDFGNLQDDGTVTFAKTGGGTTEATVSSWTDTAITVTVPSDAVSGDVIVTVLGYASDGENFAVILPAPVIDDLTQL